MTDPTPTAAEVIAHVTKEDLASWDAMTLFQQLSTVLAQSFKAPGHGKVALLMTYEGDELLFSLHADTKFSSEELLQITGNMAFALSDQFQKLLDRLISKAPSEHPDSPTPPTKH